jgi:DNA mismatch endonuclease (patch repair protein)
MTDRLTPARRSWNMRQIRSKDTRPEVVVRSLLHRMGYRFRLHCRTLPGKPDVVLPKYRAVVEVRGCYFHRHRGCRYAYAPKTRQAFWLDKFRSNVERDRRNAMRLKKAGWTVVIVWECQTRNEASLFALAKRLRRCFPRVVS